MHHQITVPVAAPRTTPTIVLYAAKQAFLWLAIPLALYFAFVTQIPAVHDSTHGARHAVGLLKCH